MAKHVRSTVDDGVVPVASRWWGLAGMAGTAAPAHEHSLAYRQLGEPDLALVTASGGEVVLWVKAANEYDHARALAGGEMGQVRVGPASVSAVGAPFRISLNALVARPRPCVLGRQVSAEVAEFCRREGIAHYVAHAGELIARHFPSIHGHRVDVDRDPETHEQWVTVNISVDDSGHLLEYYDEYTRAWVAQVPWPERSKIRLCFDVL